MSLDIRESLMRCQTREKPSSTARGREKGLGREVGARINKSQALEPGPDTAGRGDGKARSRETGCPGRKPNGRWTEMTEIKSDAYGNSLDNAMSSVKADASVVLLSTESPGK